MLERKSERIESISSDGAGGPQIYDLSKTGVSFFSPIQKEKNDFVVVKINDILLRAKVVYCQKRENDYRLGLQFWNILPDRQHKLNELVEKYSKGVPLSCSIVEENENIGTPQETKRIITRPSDREKKNG